MAAAAAVAALQGGTADVSLEVTRLVVLLVAAVAALTLGVLVPLLQPLAARAGWIGMLLLFVFTISVVLLLSML